MAQIIVLGLNRTGTKILSYLLARSLRLPSVFLEPFTWDTGMSEALQPDWKVIKRQRNRSELAEDESKRLNVITKPDEESVFLEGILSDPKWDIVKFVEIGRCQLYAKLDPGAFMVGIIREPVGFMESLNGRKGTQRILGCQWARLRQEQDFPDPLDDAEEYLPPDLADCARAYVALYGHLERFHPPLGMRVAYEDLFQSEDWLHEVGQHLKRSPRRLNDVKQVGRSTRAELNEQQRNYLEARMRPTYTHFLSDQKVSVAARSRLRRKH